MDLLCIIVGHRSEGGAGGVGESFERGPEPIIAKKSADKRIEYQQDDVEASPGLVAGSRRSLSFIEGGILDLHPEVRIEG